MGFPTGEERMLSLVDDADEIQRLRDYALQRDEENDGILVSEIHDDS